MYDLILACDSNFGIGKDNKLPWHLPEELKIFREKTNDSILIVGRKTAESLPPLPGRLIAVLSRNKDTLHKDTLHKNNYYLFNTLNEALDWAKITFPYKKIFIAGGAELYNFVLTTHSKDIDRIHLSILNDIYYCDRYVNIGDEWIIQEEKVEQKFKHQILIYKKEHSEFQYLNLIQDVLKNGKKKIGRNGETTSVFFRNMTFDLNQGFPLLTTKKMFFKGILRELLFFIKGQTNSKILEEKGVNIWKKNTDRKFLDSLGFVNRPEGIMGPMYGYQWRFFGAEYDEKEGKPISVGIDQLKNIINQIKNDPSSRRLIMTDFNPSQAHLGVLYPCHSIIIQFYVNDDELEMFCYNRSQDLFLGVPFNIASSALLLMIVAKMTGLKPGKLHMSMGDVHIYKEHYEHASSQQKLRPFKFPSLNMAFGGERDIDSLEETDFVLTNYNSHPAIKTEMIA